MKLHLPIPRRVAFFLIPGIAALAMTVRGDDKSEAGETARSPHPGTEAGIKAVADELAKPGADTVKLTAMLRPSKADYEAAFASPVAAKIMTASEGMWKSGKLAAAPKEGQTEPTYSARPPRTSTPGPGRLRRICREVTKHSKGR